MLATAFLIPDLRRFGTNVPKSFSFRYRLRMTNLKATGRSVAVIHFDAERTALLRREEVEHLAYHVSQLLTGQPTAGGEWQHLGLLIELEPDSDGGPEE